MRIGGVMTCILIYIDEETDSIRTIKGEIISRDEFFITIKDGYNNIFEIANSSVKKIKYPKGGNNV